MSRRCVLLVTLAVFILLTVDAYPRAYSLRETLSKQNVESNKREAVNYTGNVERYSGYLIKTTQPPYMERPTKKPGTYLQSIWDIYFPESGQK